MNRSTPGCGERFADPDPHSGLLKAKRLAAKLDRICPDAAGSLREGLEELFTVRRLGIDGTLARTLVCHQHDRIDDLDRSHHHPQRQTLARRRRHAPPMVHAGMAEAEGKFRRVRGHKQMPQLVTALGRHADTVTPACDTEPNELAA